MLFCSLTVKVGFSKSRKLLHLVCSNVLLSDTQHHSVTVHILHANKLEVSKIAKSATLVMQHDDHIRGKNPPDSECVMKELIQQEHYKAGSIYLKSVLLYYFEAILASY